MQLTLELSFYGFLVIAFFGIFLLGMLCRWIFGEKDILASFPETQLLPAPALDEAKKLFKKMREHIPKASTARREQLIRDLNLMERTIQEFEFRTNSGETNYRKLCEERKEFWRAMKEIVEQMSFWESLFGKNKNSNYAQSLQFYKNLSQRIDDAAENLKFQGEMLLAELRNRGVYQYNAHLLYSKQKQASAIEENEIEEKITPSESETAPLQENQMPTQEDPKTSEKKELLSARPQCKQADFPKIGINLKRYKYADLTFNIDFEESGVLRHYDFEDCIFRGVKFTGLHQYDHCHFKQADFTRSQWFQVLQPHRFEQCDFSNANFTDCHFTFTAFYHCRFDQAQWSRIKFKNVKFVSCFLNGIQWRGVDLSDAVFSKDMLATLDFSKCAELPQNHPDRQKSAPSNPSQEATLEISNPVPPSPIQDDSAETPAPINQEKEQNSQQ